MLGAGKYDEALIGALLEAGAQQGVLIVIDGAQGAGFACQLTLAVTHALPHALRVIADTIEADMKEHLS